MTVPPAPPAAPRPAAGPQSRSAPDTAPSAGRVVAVLGPTNTGKTFLAMERMLAHRTGMIGFPLRLLARENYDKVVRLKGEKAVALVTGEEKIIPPYAQYWICTVESMPLDRSVQFLCVDEIQLCADGERGHIFTDRLLHARGTEETMFLGSDTVRGLIQKLVPRVEHISRPRFSNLTYAGHKKLTKLPPRSAIVAFSTTEVYGLAEMVRRSRGGTAVVLGALSPRTRNAQVALYQSGDVDYLVATDAIGMGLNMDVDHVWFARMSKFDGVQPRRLRPTEVAQIAGRAGRHLTDGTFGTTWDCPPMDAETVTAVEGHSFPAVQQLMWRNSRLDFRSIEALTASLEERPSSPVLIRSREADDQMALQVLGKEEEIRAKARHPEAVRLLWEVCQVPDFRKVMSDQHTRLLGQMFLYLTGPGRKLPPDWMASQVGRLDRTEGDIDALVSRIAHVRTFTYVSHRADWLSDPRHWQELTRGIEDRLSDALHERLTQRFVDKRSAGLVKSLRAGRDLIGMVTKTGEVMVEGHAVGHLTGLQFTLDAEVSPEDQRALMTAARKSLKEEIATRVQQVEQAGDDAFSLDPAGQVVWQGSALARLAPGASALAPTLKPLVSEDLLDSGQRDRVMARAAAWVKAHVEAVLGPLQKLETMAELEGPARGIAFQVAEALGVVPRRTLDPLIRPLTKEQRYQLAKAGLRLGFSHVFLPALAKPKAVALRAQLWAVRHGQTLPVTVPPPGRVSVPAGEMDPRMLEAVGYPRIGHLAIRVDMLDRLEKELAQRSDSKGRVRSIADLSPLIGTSNEDLAAVLAALNWHPVEVPASELTEPAKPAPVSVPVAIAAAPADAARGETVAEPVDAAAEADTSGTETVEAAAPEEMAPEEMAPEAAAPEAAAADDAAGEAVAETGEAVEATPAEVAPTETAAELDSAEGEADAGSEADAADDETAEAEGAESEEGAETDAAAPDASAEAAVPADVPMVTVWVRRRPPRPKTQKRRPKRRPGAPGTEGEGQRQAAPADGRRREGGQRDGGPREGGQRRDDRPRPDRAPGERAPGERPQGDRAQGDRAQGDRARQDRPAAAAASGEAAPARDARGPRRDRPQGGRPQGDRPQGDRPQGDRPQGERHQGDRPQGDRPRGDRPRGDRPEGDRRGGRPDRDAPKTFEIGPKPDRSRKGDGPIDPDHPFAALQKLLGKS